ncbi:MAG TPA: universal stress protein [Bacteroidales bacterium]|nr:universal stress protein [Bacteroidales bacterium]
MKTVLIALDYDYSARKVAESGHLLATSMNAKTVLLNVISDDVYYSSLEYSPITGFTGFSNADFTLMASSEGLASASGFFLEQIKSHLHDESIQIVVGKGDFSDTILKTATDMEADVIVMGSHGRKWLDHILVGSVTEKVLHQTKIPLFIVPVKEPRK